MSILKLSFSLTPNHCPHCSTKVSRQLRKLLLVYGEARCLWCGYMLVPRITSLLPIKFLSAIIFAGSVNWMLKSFFPDAAHFFVLVPTIVAAYIAFRVCDCFSQLKAFDV